MSVFAALMGASGAYADQAGRRIEDKRKADEDARKDRMEQIREQRKKEIEMELADYRAGIAETAAQADQGRRMEELQQMSTNAKGLVGAQMDAALQKDQTVRDRDRADIERRNAEMSEFTGDPANLNADMTPNIERTTAGMLRNGRTDLLTDFNKAVGRNYDDKWETDRYRAELASLASQIENSYGERKTELQRRYDEILFRMNPDVRPRNSAGGGAPRISSEAEYRSLPSGSVFIAPDGTERVKP